MEEFLEALHAKSNMATVVDNRLECKFVQRSKVRPCHSLEKTVFDTLLSGAICPGV